MLNNLNNLLYRLLLALVLLAPLALPARAQDRADEVRALLEQRDREIKALLGDKETFTPEQRERLKDVINAGIDFAAMGRQALGRYWDELTPQQRAEFVEVFSDIVRAHSLSNLDAYRSKVVYDTITVEGDSAYVLTTTTYDDVTMKVAYVLGYHDGQWWVYDIILDDVSTVEGYARSFQALIRKKGFEVLMERLRERRAKALAESAG
ncbi:MAG: ABC transporter substrate-binding protein [Rhodothermaceae bacterium]|nr:MAG: ABC transporter substrate-binding protein [Rhodothermaceae bacterium]